MNNGNPRMLRMGCVEPLTGVWKLADPLNALYSQTPERTRLALQHIGRERRPEFR